MDPIETENESFKRRLSFTCCTDLLMVTYMYIDDQDLIFATEKYIRLSHRCFYHYYRYQMFKSWKMKTNYFLSYFLTFSFVWLPGNVAQPKKSKSPFNLTRQDLAEWKFRFRASKEKKNKKINLLFFVFMLCNQLQSNMLNMSPELFASSVNSVAWGTWMGFR